MGEEGYVGLDVVRAARIAAPPRAGRCSRRPRTRLVAADPVEGVGTIFLGEHEPKDIPDRVPMHQLVIGGAPDPLRGAPLHPESAAAEPVQIKGRESEISRELEGVVRDLRTSIEQRVADSLAQSFSGVEKPRRRQMPLWWPLVFSAAVVLMVVLVPIVWLLTR